MVFGSSLRGLLLHHDDHAESSFVALHLGKSLSGFLERHGLNHRADIGEHAEGQSVLSIAEPVNAP